MHVCVSTLCGNIDAMMDNNYVTIGDNYVTISDIHVTDSTYMMIADDNHATISFPLVVCRI